MSYIKAFLLICFIIYAAQGAAINENEEKVSPTQTDLEKNVVEDRQASVVGSAVGSAVGTAITATSQIVGAIVLPLANAVGPITGTIFNGFLGPQNGLRNAMMLNQPSLLIINKPPPNQFNHQVPYGIINIPDQGIVGVNSLYSNLLPMYQLTNSIKDDDLKSSLNDLSKTDNKQVSYVELIEHFDKLSNMGISMDTLEHIISEKKNKKRKVENKSVKNKGSN